MDIFIKLIESRLTGFIIDVIDSLASKAHHYHFHCMLYDKVCQYVIKLTSYSLVAYPTVLI